MRSARSCQRLFPSTSPKKMLGLIALPCSIRQRIPGIRPYRLRPMGFSTYSNDREEWVIVALASFSARDNCLKTQRTAFRRRDVHRQSDNVSNQYTSVNKFHAAKPTHAGLS